LSEALRDYLDFASETAWLAGRLTLGYFRTGVRADLKEDESPVTAADRRAEELIRSRIERRYPGHAIIGEEFGEEGRPGATHRWFVDPIDGTVSFIRGVPLYAVLIGLEIEGRIEVGAACFPALDETLTAATRLGCRLNGRRVRVRETERLSESIVSFTNPSSFGRHARSEEWARVLRSTRYQAGWPDAYGHALVATGRLELMLDPVMNPWDCGPFPVILREAGGYFGDWSGNETIHGGEAMSTTQRLLPEVLRLLSG
jgi:histidinol-phosphatase